MFFQKYSLGFFRSFTQLYEQYSQKYEKESILNDNSFLENSSPKKQKSSHLNIREICERIYISYSVLEDTFVINKIIVF